MTDPRRTGGLKDPELFSAQEIARLPKWAALRVETLLANCTYHERRLAEAVGGTGASEVYLDHFDHGKRVNLPRGSRVHFVVPSGTVEVYVEDGFVVNRVVPGNHALERLAVTPFGIQQAGVRVEAR